MLFRRTYKISCPFYKFVHQMESFVDPLDNRLLVLFYENKNNWKLYRGPCGSERFKALAYVFPEAAMLHRI